MQPRVELAVPAEVVHVFVAVRVLTHIAKVVGNLPSLLDLCAAQGRPRRRDVQSLGWP